MNGLWLAFCLFSLDALSLDQWSSNWFCTVFRTVDFSAWLGDFLPFANLYQLSRQWTFVSRPIVLATGQRNFLCCCWSTTTVLQGYFFWTIYITRSRQLFSIAHSGVFSNSAFCRSDEEISRGSQLQQRANTNCFKFYEKVTKCQHDIDTYCFFFFFLTIDPRTWFCTVFRTVDFKACLGVFVTFWQPLAAQELLEQLIHVQSLVYRTKNFLAIGNAALVPIVFGKVWWYWLLLILGFHLVEFFKI